jgi:hypothetical protein
MPDSLPEFLRKRSEQKFRAFLKEIEDLTPEQALRFAEPNWPDHRWGIGQNGSIAGIVYHVAAWKQMTLPLLSPTGRALSRQEFDTGAAPAANDWPGLIAWYRQAGEAWNRQMALLPDEEFDAKRQWEGATLTVAALIVEIMEHDIQHASQIEYLRQRIQTEGN